ncbi:sulfate permease, SulP family [Halolactibacillus halophilus]|uniref:Sodium-independent anion transporter n=1 Tax=Halolactibacillus halophilus TaxID=306540 RepID=A0A1I5S8C9_9BACI|nr:SulP family inorganic anion transporter [Halolactibacillus halophilus]GEM02704.1 sodium-independent anion transporter [Halolactibacillus halophilus]SFP66939.1 sulfate permease, SulP family [Halolactibacillus halophilus]
MLDRLRQDYLSNIKGDILSGVVVALALIPESIAFSIIAGVDPMVGLYAAFIISIMTGVFGGRPGMISGATGAMALLMGPLIRDYGLDYLLAATILTGVIQYVFGALKIARLMKFIPRAVMIGFVNALAILIFTSQIPHFIGISNLTYIFVGVTLAIIYILPRFTTAVPAPLVAIIILTGIALFYNLDLNTVGDLGTISNTLPSFIIPNVPFTFETLTIIFPYAIALAIVGLLESLLTATIVDDLTDTDSNKNKESRGQGLANIVTGFFGGMAGCAMIGQSIINIKSGGRSRLSSVVAGVFLIFLVLVLSSLVVQIPMPILVGIMIMVSIGTFDWGTFKYLKKAPKSDALVMLVTVGIVVYTHDLSQGVIAGVVLSAILFVAKISVVHVEKSATNQGQLYQVKGQLFFASVDSFKNGFDYTLENQTIEIEFKNAHIWDDSAVFAIDQVILKLRQNQNTVMVKHLNEDSQALVDQLAVFDDPNAKLSAH